MSVVTRLNPTTMAEAAAALAETTGRVRITGAGTAPDWAGAPAPAEHLLDTTGLTGVIAHHPADMTVEVRAGTPLRELNTLLAAHGQRVALDAARVAHGATVGGLIATADAGPLALANGSMRDLVIGAVLVLPDGTPARTGSHVIKNVAGYDLAKLVHGCHGTLALIAEVTLRLHPLPEAEATVRLAGPLDDAAEATGRLLREPLEPVAVEWSDDALLVRLEGGAAALPARVARVVEALGAGAEALDEDAAAAAWDGHAAQVHPHPLALRGDTQQTVHPSGAVLRVGTRPSRLAPLLGELAGTRVTAGLATGVGTLTLPAEPDVVAEAHRRVHAVGGTSMLRSRPAGTELPAWGPPPSALGLLRAVHAELDPTGRLGAGRFTPWLEETA
ncbi:FAD-binding oxidoreductase [Pseudonocardia eucalypti]|uniref:FAD-binding oxidoreductase n=1 Tax=Pseudonocardia eucalypti TaxID=648755 RepID=A0ABP9QA02_9PSEU|nr:glycolate oxidase FAD binding subunit [Pseudonocardia eucalypti]